MQKNSGFARPIGRRALRIAAALLVSSAMAGGIATPAHAQESEASLRGKVTGGATEITAVEVSTGINRTVSVASDGSYNFASLRPGTYRLDVRAGQEVRSTDTFTLNVAQNAQLDFSFTEIARATPPANANADQGTLPPASSNVGSGQDILVVGRRLVTEEGGEVGANISQRLIEQLPQNNRNFLAFADLAPGVQFIEEGVNGQARIQGGAQGSNAVNVFIDGVSQKDFVLKNGITGQDSTQGNPFPQLAVGEYRVISSNYKAEFDQVGSVAITAITKSGTNKFHGEGFVDFTNEKLRAATPTEKFQENGVKRPTKYLQFGGSLSGPIIRDVVHFFVTYEGKRIQNPVDIFPGGGILPSALPSQYQNLFGVTTNDFNENLFFGKITIAPTSKDLFEFTGKYRDETGEQISGGTVTAEASTQTEVDEIRLLGRWQRTEDNWVNDLRLSYQDVSWSPRPTILSNGRLFQATIRNGNSVSRFDLFRVGGGTNFQDKGQTGFTFQDDFTFTGFEGHTIKTGFKVNKVELKSLQQNFFNPLFTYDTNLNGQDSFNETIPYRVQFGAPSGPGNSVVTSKNTQFGIYVQDDWEVNDRLTLNLGVRWDYEETPAYLNYVTPEVNRTAISASVYPNLTNANYNINDFISDGNDRKAFTGAFQPRLGFSYELDSRARFILFGGYGRSYDRNQFDFLQQEVSVGSYQVRTFNFLNANSLVNEQCRASLTCIPFDPIYLTREGLAKLAVSSPGGGRELRFITNDLKVPYSDQFSLGLRSRFRAFNVEVGYTHIESKDGFAYLLGNRRPDGSFFFDNPASATDVPGSPFTFTPPGFGNVLIGVNGLKTSSDAGYLKFNKRYTRNSRWSLDGTYTFTKAEENRQFGEVFSLDYPTIADYPTLRSAGVPRHRIVVAGSVDTFLGVTLSSRLTYQSPIYLKAFINTAVPFERTIVGTEVESNGARWGRRQLDVAATKYFKVPFFTDGARIRFRVDVLNVLNDRNYTSFNNNPNDNTRTTASPSIYGERTGFGTGGNRPRTFKLSTGFNF